MVWLYPHDTNNVISNKAVHMENWNKYSLYTMNLMSLLLIRHIKVGPTLMTYITRAMLPNLMNVQWGTWKVIILTTFAVIILILTVKEMMFRPLFLVLKWSRAGFTMKASGVLPDMLMHLSPGHSSIITMLTLHKLGLMHKRHMRAFSV